MSDITHEALDWLESVIDRKIQNAVSKSDKTQYKGRVLSKDKEGVVWVEVPGVADKLPADISLVDVSNDDVVQVTIGNGLAVVDGNTTNPSAGVSRVIEVEGTAFVAKENADMAFNAALSAQNSANYAAVAAISAENSAEQAGIAANQALADAGRANQAASNALQSAENASLFASSALDQLGIVQDVIGVLDYASKNGTFEQTSDTSPQEGTVYFTYDSQSHDYTPVVEPAENPAQAGYYVLVYSEDSMGEFIMSHLAVTSRGLWVLPNGINSGNVTPDSSIDSATQSDTQAQIIANARARFGNNYKMLLANDGTYIYDGNGIMVAQYKGDGIEYAAGRSFHIGSENAYILYTPASGNTPASITIGGSNINLGDSRTLSELMQTVDGTLIYDHDYVYNSDHTQATFTAHLYRGGVDIAPSMTQAEQDQFTWYYKNEDDDEHQYIGSGLTVTVNLSDMGYGSHIIGKYTTMENAALLTEDDEPLTTSEDEQLIARTAVGESVRVSDLSVATVLYDTDKLMVVGPEDEHLVTVETLKDVFGTTSYDDLSDRPSIEGVTLIGNNDFPDLGIFQTDAQGYDVPDDYTLTSMDINALWSNAVPVS